MGTREDDAHSTVTNEQFCRSRDMNNSFRPDWDKCSRLVVDWKHLSIGKNTDELMEVVLNEISYGNTEENTEEHLRQASLGQPFEERLSKNRHLRRRMTGLLIKDIWSSKLHNENKVRSTP